MSVSSTSAPIPLSHNPSRTVVNSPPNDFFSPSRTVGFEMPSPKVFREEKAKTLKELSAAQSKTKVLLLEGVNQTGIELFEKQGYEIESFAKALPEEDLKNKIKDVHFIGIRSKTMLTKEVLAEAKNLVAIGCFCIGTNQVDLAYAQSRGIPVFNSPFSNSRSVAELVMGEMVALSRQLGDKNNEMHKGVWNKPVLEECFELRGKTVGIVGYGHIGCQVSVMADALGMKVIFYDVIPLFPLGTARQIPTLDALLQEADFVTLHVPETDETKNMIGEEQLKVMKKGSFLLNNARGSVVDLKALAKYLKNGHLKGAAVDVYPKEPEANGPGFESELLDCPNVIMTPHIGGSTEEAQRAIGIEVASTMIKYLKNGSSLGAVNFPLVELKSPLPDSMIVRILNIHENVPGVLRQINKALSPFNLVKQTCESTEKVAYMVADVALQSPEEIKLLGDVQAEFDKMAESIKTRILY